MDSLDCKGLNLYMCGVFSRWDDLENCEGLLDSITFFHFSYLCPTQLWWARAPGHIHIIDLGWFCIKVCLESDFLKNLGLKVYSVLAISVRFSELILPLFKIEDKISHWLLRLPVSFSILLIDINRNGVRIGNFSQAKIKKFSL